MKTSKILVPIDRADNKESYYQIISSIRLKQIIKIDSKRAILNALSTIKSIHNIENRICKLEKKSPLLIIFYIDNTI